MDLTPSDKMVLQFLNRDPNPYVREELQAIYLGMRQHRSEVEALHVARVSNLLYIPVMVRQYALSQNVHKGFRMWMWQ